MLPGRARSCPRARGPANGSGSRGSRRGEVATRGVKLRSVRRLFQVRLRRNHVSCSRIPSASVTLGSKPSTRRAASILM